MASASSPSLAPGSTLPAVILDPALAAQGRRKRAPRSMHPSSLVTSHHPPTTQAGPGSTVQYPFPVDYYQDREAVVYSLKGAQPRGLCTLPGSVYNVPVRVDILHRVVRWIRAMWRQGTHKVKRRGEVSGGGRKPWAQKGSGRARHGSIRSPIWVGGGVAHGPIPRSHAHDLPLNIQLLGYKCALSAKANEGRLVVVDSLVPEPVFDEARGLHMVKTKHTEKRLRALLAHVPHQSALLVDCGEDALDGGEPLRRGARNLPWACIMPWQQVTVYHLLKYQALVITQPAVMAMAARLQLPPSTDAAAHQRATWRRQQQAAYQQALELLMTPALAAPQAGALPQAAAPALPA